jgi:hypothetical protein
MYRLGEAESIKEAADVFEEKHRINYSPLVEVAWKSSEMRTGI